MGAQIIALNRANRDGFPGGGTLTTLSFILTTEGYHYVSRTEVEAVVLLY